MIKHLKTMIIFLIIGCGLLGCEGKTSKVTHQPNFKDDFFDKMGGSEHTPKVYKLMESSPAVQYIELKVYATRIERKFVVAVGNPKREAAIKKISRGAFDGVEANKILATIPHNILCEYSLKSNIDRISESQRYIDGKFEGASYNFSGSDTTSSSRSLMTPGEGGASDDDAMELCSEREELLNSWSSYSLESYDSAKLTLEPDLVLVLQNDDIEEK